MMHRPAIRHLLSLSTCFALVLIVASSGSAQAIETEALNAAIKFDEFERLGWCDLSARLDNFAIQLQQTQDVAGYVLSYGPEGNNPGTGKSNMWMIQDYLVNSRGILKERLRTVYGGRYQNLAELKTELWIVPHDAQPPDFKEYENNSNSFNGKFAEFQSSEMPNEALGPSSGDATLAGFADALRQQPKAQAYIVAYSSRTVATGAWRRIAKGIASGLEKGQSVEADRIKIIFAGYDEKLGEDESVKIHLWILPEGAPPPVKEVEAERRPEKAVRLGDFNQYTLGDSAEGKRALEGFADVLRADEQLRACVIVRLSTEPPDAEAEPDQPPATDLLQLVEKWKTDLFKDYKIDGGRIVITVAMETENYPGGYLETWIVPPGASLPDPYAPQEEPTEEVEEENPQGL